jgi:hypothetical protein
MGLVADEAVDRRVPVRRHNIREAQDIFILLLVCVIGTSAGEQWTFNKLTTMLP